MLSLNGLKNLSAAPDYAEISDEDNLNGEVAEIINSDITVEYLINMAKKHFDKAKAKKTYYACWVDSMSELIYDAGSTEEDFLKMLA